MTSIAPAIASQQSLATRPRPWSGGLWLQDVGAGMPSTDLMELIHMQGNAVALDRDEALFYEGDPAEAVHAVIAGTVRCFKLLGDGRRQIIRFCKAGDLLGVSLGPDYMYSAEGVTDVRLRRLNRKRLDALCDQHPKLCDQLLSICAAELAAAEKQIVSLGRKTAHERICSFLLGHNIQKGNKIELPMSRTDIADYVGLTIETVSRTLSRLRSAGLIRMICCNSLELTDPERLSRLADPT
jgi:CRP/FNR family transcriptional regulator, anaerobic regulatory protein